jgi:hypothetical protein
VQEVDSATVAEGGRVLRKGIEMKSKLWYCGFMFCVTLLLSAKCSAQKVPVVMQAPRSVNEDRTALRFSKSISDEIQLSGKFYLWTRDSSEFPLSGVRIIVRSIQVKLKTGEELGSAIFVEADRASVKDPEYSKVVLEEMWMIPKDDSVADQTRGFLAELNRILER